MLKATSSAAGSIECGTFRRADPPCGRSHEGQPVIVRAPALLRGGCSVCHVVVSIFSDGSQHRSACVDGTAARRHRALGRLAHDRGRVLWKCCAGIKAPTEFESHGMRC